MMVCTCEILTGGGAQFGQVKSVDIKISFSREGVMMVYTCEILAGGRCNVMECTYEILAGDRCNVMECKCEILTVGGQLGHVKSIDIKISFSREGVM